MDTGEEQNARSASRLPQAPIYGTGPLFPLLWLLQQRLIHIGQSLNYAGSVGSSTAFLFLIRSDCWVSYQSSVLRDLSQKISLGRRRFIFPYQTRLCSCSSEIVLCPCSFSQIDQPTVVAKKQKLSFYNWLAVYFPLSSSLQFNLSSHKWSISK